jgi:hypothetical protein
MKLCWCDRVGVGWAMLVLGLYFWIWGSSPGGILSMPDGAATHVLLVVVLPLWIALRLIDMMSGGPWNRMAQRRGEFKISVHRNLATALGRYRRPR